MGRLTLVLGGQKSGKSRLAASRATASGRPVVVVAPAKPRDPEFAARVARHRADRPAHWRTLETFDLAGALAEAGPGAFVLVDALDTWLADQLETAGVPLGDGDPSPALRQEAQVQVLAAVRGLAAAAAARDGEVLVIAGTPGLGVHAGGPGARYYVDLHGLAVQELSAAADEALLVVAGRAVPLPPADRAVPPGPAGAAPGPPRQHAGPPPAGRSDRTADVEHLVAAVAPVNPGAAAAARQRHARLAKPPGSLGRLEELSARLAAICGRCPPPVPGSPAVVVAAADHGVHGQGVSDWPQEVTAAMVATVATGRASVSALARAVGARVVVLDVGTRTTGRLPAGVRDARVRAGTADLTVGPAMTLDECRAAVAAGAATAAELVAHGVDLLVTGEVGIGNTTASACLVSAFTGAAPQEVTGRGANRDDARVSHKRRVVERALARHGEDRRPLPTLASLGGLEHAALVGVMLAGAAARVPVVLDGVVSGAAALAAVALCPDLAGYLIAGHASAEPGAAAVLDQLELPPLLDLGMKLGEGSGGVLAVPVVQAAARVLAETATLDEVIPPGPQPTSWPRQAARSQTAMNPGPSNQ